MAAVMHGRYTDKGMTRALVYAILLHVVIVLFFGINFRWLSQQKNAGDTVIKAKAVVLPEKTTPEPVPKPKQKAKPESKKQVKKKVSKKVKKKAKKKKRDKKQQQEIEKQLQEQLKREQQAAAAAATKAAALLEKYKTVIRQKVSRNWIRPAGVAGGKQCVVHVRLIAGGEVVNAQVVKSSGDPAFDRSVESAVYKAAPLPVPDDPDMFDYFRDIEFLFKPGD